MSYRDRTGTDRTQGSAIEVRSAGPQVFLELGVMRNFGSIAADAWAALSAAEARELALDLCLAASQLEARTHAETFRLLRDGAPVEAGS